MYDIKTKGLQKIHDRWLKNEIDDYILSSEDPKASVEANYKKIQESLTVNPDTDHAVSHHQPKLKPNVVKHLKVNPDFNFVATWSKLSTKPLQLILQFLSVNELAILIQTCKHLSKVLDNNETWAHFLMIDMQHDIDTMMRRRSMTFKEIYKYEMFAVKGKTFLYHTFDFLRWPFTKYCAETANLAKTMVDFVVTSDLQSLLENEILKNIITDNLKLSWIKERNEICLWVSGYDWFNVEQPKGRKQLRLNKILKPTSRLIKMFEYDKKERITRTFFLSEKYLVVELDVDSGHINNKEEESKEMEESLRKTRTTFMIYNLEKELKFSMFGEDYQPPLKVSFLINYTQEEVKSKSSQLKDEFIIEYEGGKNQKTPGYNDIRLKALNHEEILIFTMNTNQPLIAVYNVSKRQELCFRTIKIENPLFDISYPRCSIQKKLRLVDETINVYELDWLSNPALDLCKFTSSINQEESKVLTCEEESLNTIKPYYLGSYLPTNNENNKVPIEYLIIFKSGTFYFVDIETRKVKEFSPEEKVSNWEVYEDKLVLFSSCHIFIYQFSFREFKIQRYNNKVLEKDIKEDLCQMTFLSPCYTIIMVERPRTSNWTHNLNIYIGSTQKLIHEKIFNGSWKVHEVNLSILLAKPDKKSAFQQISVRFEGEKLFLRTSHYCFFIDLLVYWKKEDFESAELLEGVQNINVEDIVDENVQKQPTNSASPAKKASNFVPFKPNANKHEGKVVEPTRWSSADRKGSVEKDEKHVEKVVRDKSSKYHKNIRQKGRQAKIDS